VRDEEITKKLKGEEKRGAIKRTENKEEYKKKPGSKLGEV
jgi:hypothetical protein